MDHIPKIQRKSQECHHQKIEKSKHKTKIENGQRKVWNFTNGHIPVYAIRLHEGEEKGYIPHHRQNPGDDHQDFQNNA